MSQTVVIDVNAQTAYVVHPLANRYSVVKAILDHESVQGEGYLEGPTDNEAIFFLEEDANVDVVWARISVVLRTMESRLAVGASVAR